MDFIDGFAKEQVGNERAPAIALSTLFRRLGMPLKILSYVVFGGFACRATWLLVPMDRALHSASLPAKDAPCFKELIRELPKIELHQHLTGSLKGSSLKEELARKGLDPDQALAQDLTPLNEIDTKDEWDHLSRYCIACAKAAEWTEGEDERQEQLFGEAFELLKQAGVVYCELRVGLKAEPTKEAYLRRLLNAVDRVNQDPESSLQLGVIVSVARHGCVDYGRESADVAMSFWQRGSAVCGLELGGVPSRSDFNSDWLPVFQAAKDLGMPVALHCGEDAAKQNEWADMLDFGPQRLGHCVFLDEANLGTLFEKQIPVEACLTCHLQHFKVPLEQNIFGKLHETGQPVVLGTDNPSIYGISLSDEYELACQTFSLTFSELFALVRASVEFTFLSAAGKEALRSRVDSLIEALRDKYQIGA